MNTINRELLNFGLDEKVVCDKDAVKWYRKGKLHRDNEPAVLYTNGTREWYQNGLLHRTDGPAVIYTPTRQEWWINGKKADPLVQLIKQIELNKGEAND